MLIQKIGNIGKTYRQLERYSEILGVFIKFGFGDIVASLRVEQYIDFGRQLIFRKKKEKIETHTRAERVRMALEELGPTFIKLGQMLSTRPDILPAEFIRELSKLLDEVPPFPYEEAKEIIETELKSPLLDTFTWVDPEPLAAASIGQVHKARLTDGEDVVIKVQRPGIKRTVAVDLEILFHIATLMEKHLEGFDVHKPTEVVEEFGLTIEREMDYSIEAANMERLTGQFLDDERVRVPKVYRRATTSKVLTMEYIRGINIGNFEELHKAGYDLARIADLGAELIVEQTLVNGFFHADPHSANLLVLPGYTICFLDLGMTGHVDRQTREIIIDLIMGVVRREAKLMVNALFKLTIWDAEPDRRALEREVLSFIDTYFFRPIKEMQLGHLLEEVFKISMKYRMRVPPDLLLLIKALTVTESLGRQLDPEFDIIQKASPYIRKMQMARYSPKRLADDFWVYGTDLLQLFKEVPGEFRTLLRMARSGKMKIDIEHKGLEEMRITQERTSNRLAFAVVLASLIIGSSVIIQSGIPPTWHGVPVIGLIGYLVAGVMGFWLLISILRRGMM